MIKPTHTYKMIKLKRNLPNSKIETSMRIIFIVTKAIDLDIFAVAHIGISIK